MVDMSEELSAGGIESVHRQTFHFFGYFGTGIETDFWCVISLCHMDWGVILFVFVSLGLLFSWCFNFLGVIFFVPTAKQTFYWGTGNSHGCFTDRKGIESSSITIKHITAWRYHTHISFTIRFDPHTHHILRSNWSTDCCNSSLCRYHWLARLML